MLLSEHSFDGGGQHLLGRGRLFIVTVALPNQGDPIDQPAITGTQAEASPVSGVCVSHAATR